MIARLGAAWRDPAYKHARRAGAAIAAIAPVAEPANLAAEPARAASERRLRAVPDIDSEAAGGEDGPSAFPWS